MLLFDPLIGVAQEIDGHRLSREPRRLDIRLDGHGGVFERCLTHRDIGHGEVPGRLALAEHHRINRRHTGEVVEGLARVRGATVGQQENARQRPAPVAFGESPQGRAEGRGLAVEGEIGEIGRPPQTGIEEILAQLEVLGNRREPARRAGLQVALRISPRLWDASRS